MWVNESPELEAVNLGGIFLPPFEQFAHFRCKLSLEFSTAGFLVKTASSTEEVIQALALRHQVFIENDQGHGIGYEYDQFDNDADHVLVIAKESNEVVATSRLLCSRFASQFYSQNEFDIEDVLNENKAYLEMGRSCIKITHRNANLVDLMWRAIGSYITRTQTKALFGLASVFTTDQSQAWELDAYFKTFFSDNRFNVMPKLAWQLDPAFRKSTYQFEDDTQCKKILPSLLRSYLMAGAKIYGDPALDRDFSCVDFFAYIDIDNMHRSFEKRYLS